jgi:ATP-dependent Clp protease protease subunit
MDFEAEELMSFLTQNVKEDIKSFSDIVNLEGNLNRELFVYTITEGVGSDINGYIRFWNSYDEKHNIPIDQRKPIKIYFDSDGGLLNETFIIIDSIAMSKTPVWTICIGSAYSGGFFSFIAGHRRIAYPQSSFLYHEGSAGNSGTAAQFQNFSAFYKKQLNQLKDIVLRYTKIDEKKYSEIVKEDFWLTAEEALELGVCDEIAEEFV